MRYALAAVAIFLCGCSNVARTSSEPDEGATYRDGRPRAHHIIVAPVYPDDRALVMLACQRAALVYFGHIDAHDDGHLAVDDHNGWFGATMVQVDLEDADGGTRVNVEAVCRNPELFTDREHMVMDRYLTQVEIEMQTIRGLRAALNPGSPDPTTADPSASVASGSTEPAAASPR